MVTEMVIAMVAVIVIVIVTAMVAAMVTVGERRNCCFLSNSFSSSNVMMIVKRINY